MTNLRRKPARGRWLAIAALALAMVGAPVAAGATTWTVGASNESFNITHYYGTPRYHAGGSGAAYHLASHSPGPQYCGSYFWLALRNSAGDSTQRNIFYGTGVANSFKWHTGALSIPAGSYYITARNDAAGCSGLKYTWSGTLALN